ncbi:hypothetical protein ABPG72_010668 [Tetrahymena utriculariae]
MKQSDKYTQKLKIIILMQTVACDYLTKLLPIYIIYYLDKQFLKISFFIVLQLLKSEERKINSQKAKADMKQRLLLGNELHLIHENYPVPPQISPQTSPFKSQARHQSFLYPSQHREFPIPSLSILTQLEELILH